MVADAYARAGATSTTHRCAYIPFGAGPRVCIGNHFALMEGQLLLAQIAQRYDLKLVPNQKIEREVAVTMRPKYGMRMVLSPVR
jgi:cytochrome P450